MKTKCNKSITLFTFIGAEKYEADSINALRISYEKFHFDKVVCAIHKISDWVRKEVASFCPEAELCEVGHCSIEGYNFFIVHHLTNYINTDYVMLVQDDGFILNEDKWKEEFLDYDYIGSLWNTDQEPYRVGNGGFCIRSKKFLEASATMPCQLDDFSHTGEDVYLCRIYREALTKQFGITYAPVEIAALWGVENAGEVPEHKDVDVNNPDSYCTTFGFHGRGNGAILKKYHSRNSDFIPATEDAENHESQKQTQYTLDERTFIKSSVWAIDEPEGEGKLKRVYNKYKMADGGGDKGTAHSYINIYEKYIIKDPCALLELGVYEGHSIAMWKEFLPASRIVGVDIDLSRVSYPMTRKFDLSEAELIKDNGTEVSFAKRFEDETFDYIIDDASHHIDDQMQSFLNLFSKLKGGGFYFIEDIPKTNVRELTVFMRKHQNEFGFRFRVHDWSNEVKHVFCHKTFKIVDITRDDDIIIVIEKAVK